MKLGYQVSLLGNKTQKNIFLIFLLFLVSSCSANKKDFAIENEQFEPNIQKRQERARDQGGSIVFGGLNKNPATGTVDFASSNVLWRASLKTLDFIPLTSVDYGGGLIVTDWYTDTQKNEQIKIQIQFVSNELRSNSLIIKSFKRNCEKNDVCQNLSISDNFNSQIKESILNTARLLKIEETKKKK